MLEDYLSTRVHSRQSSLPQPYFQTPAFYPSANAFYEHYPRAFYQDRPMLLTSNTSSASPSSAQHHLFH